MELVTLNIIIHPLICAICRAFDDDDDQLIQLLLLILRGSDWEMGTKYRSSELISNIKTPTPGSSVTDAISNVGQYLGFGLMNTLFPRFSVTQSLFDLMSDYEDADDSFSFADDTVQSGAYEGHTKLFKYLMKMTPLHSLFEQYYDPKSKRIYQETQIQHLSDDER